MKTVSMTIALAALTGVLTVSGGVRVVPGVPYVNGGDKMQCGDLHLPEKVSRKTQMLLLIHGGGWTWMSRRDVVGIADFFVKDLGFAVYNIDYRLVSEKNPWPDCGDDCVAAAEFLLNGAFSAGHGLRCDRIWICGASAGGHLALWALTHLPRHRVAGTVSISSIGDPASYLDAKEWLWSKLKVDRDSFGKMDPRFHILPGMAPVLCTHATKDNVVDIASHKAFADAYRAAGNKVEFYEYPNDIHKGLIGHCIWIPGSKPHKLIPEIEERIREFVRPKIDLGCVYRPHWRRIRLLDAHIDRAPLEGSL